jgi:hypothetical protein
MPIAATRGTKAELGSGYTNLRHNDQKVLTNTETEHFGSCHSMAAVGACVVLCMPGGPLLLHMRPDNDIQ